MWRRNPLLQFATFGALLFFAYGLLHDTRTGDANRIELSAADIERIRELWAMQWKRPPTENELQGLVEAHIREEVLYREALAMGLDEGDTVIRRRLAQRVTFMAEDLASRVEPTPEELQRHFEAQLDRYLLPARVSFSHIYFSVDRRGDEAESDARAALAHPETARGDPFMLQSDFPSRTQQEVRELFGVDFARALFEVEPADWRGPIASSYGLHLVRVHERTETAARGPIWVAGQLHDFGLVNIGRRRHPVGHEPLGQLRNREDTQTGCRRLEYRPVATLSPGAIPC